MHHNLYGIKLIKLKQFLIYIYLHLYNKRKSVLIVFILPLFLLSNSSDASRIVFLTKHIFLFNFNFKQSE